MADDQLPKFALVSHILPPATSGQSVIIQRLLADLLADQYILISREAYPQTDAGGTARLPGRYFQLKSAAPQLTAHKRRFQSIRQFTDIPGQIRARARELQRIFLNERVEVAIACTGDLYDLPATALAARWLGIPFVPYLFDDYLYQWTGPMRTIVRRMEPGLMRQAAAIIGPNEFLATAYRDRYGVEIALIRNLCPVGNLTAIYQPEMMLAHDAVNIVYVGSVYRAHFDAFRNLAAALDSLVGQPLKLHIYTMQDRGELAKEGIVSDRIVFHKPLPQEEILSVVRAADWLFLPLAFHSPIPEIIRTSAPGKLGEYLAVERPILVHVPADSFISWYFEQYGCGLVVDQDSAEVLAKKLGEALKDRAALAAMAHRARLRAEADFAEPIVRAKFKELLRSL